MKAINERFPKNKQPLTGHQIEELKIIPLGEFLPNVTREQFIEAIRIFKKTHDIKLKYSSDGNIKTEKIKSFKKIQNIELKNLLHGNVKEEIKSFKKIYNIKLKDLLDGNIKNEEINQLRREFFGNNVIYSYLRRDAEKVVFDEKGNPILENARVDEKEKKLNSDYYELRIYELLPYFAETNFLSFRKSIVDKKFYESGTTRGAMTAKFETLQKAFLSKGIYIECPGDIYDIRDNLIGIENHDFLYSVIEKHKENNIRFILSPNHESKHATSIISILDANHKVLASIFINSLQNELYYDYINKCFQPYISPEANYVDKSDVALKELDKLGYSLKKDNEEYIFKSNTSDSSKEIVIDHSKKRIFLSTYETYKNIPKEIEGTYSRVRFRSYIPERPTIILLAKNKWNLIDASHDLQKNDECCVQYGENFLTAIAKMLSDESVKSNILTLAQTVSDGKEGATEATEKLKHIFQHDLRKHLPMYYNEKGEQKDPEKIKEHHIKQRWKLGNESLAYYIS